MTPELPRRIERINYLLAGLLAGAGALFLSTPNALGLLVGALISALHFSGLRWIVEGVRKAERQRRTAFALLLVPHLLVTMGAVIVAILFLPIAGGAMLVGFSIFLVSIVAATVVDLHSAGQGEDDASS